MQINAPCFTSFNAEINTFSLPQRFTFPFYYQPHPLCLLASQELQQLLEQVDAKEYDFNDNGKMIGVLLVETKAGDIGYLSAFSGKVTKHFASINFVPDVDDSINEDFFKVEQRAINKLNDQVRQLEKNPEIGKLEDIIFQLNTQANQEISQCQKQASVQKKSRKAQRTEAEKTLSKEAFKALKLTLAKESVSDKNELKYLKLAWQEKLDSAQQSLNMLLVEIKSIKDQRSQMSSALQQRLFAQYQFLNIEQETKSLTDIFVETAFHQRYGVPPAGAGDCAAPKLLQYAFKEKMKPLAMAEFWWGKSPKSEVRQHKNFYTACIGKCQPILTHMLTGMEVDENPMLKASSKNKIIDIIYQDNDMAVIDKPSELLSVPGKEITDSVYSRMKLLFPYATGPLIVHRLDMSTSGLMVIALTKQAHKKLQQQFIKRYVEKRYVALLSGYPEQMNANNEGVIDLPLAGDFDDRPRQMVCFDTGKLAETRWHKIAVESKGQQTLTRVHLFPKTGRTHQLRVHCAHQLGFNTPIVGDDLYGKSAERLHLHAEKLKLSHPRTNELMEFIAPAKF